MTKGQRAYWKFLQTDFWKDMSAMKRRIVGRCERCPSVTDLQCHHRVYRKDWGDTRMEDLEVVCRKYHKKEHGFSSPEREEFERINSVCCDISEIVNSRLHKGKPMRRKERKYLRHIAEVYSYNGGVVFRFKNVMELHYRIVAARSSGLRGNDALVAALETQSKEIGK